MSKISHKKAMYYSWNWKSWSLKNTSFLYLIEEDLCIVIAFPVSEKGVKLYQDT